jgi:putative component of membrane protein insertase Oxa1/YidC/SpoIIIJ protein YidD
MLWYWGDESISEDSINGGLPKVRIILIGVILLYQWVAPKSLRERCIFVESCSHIVMRRTRESGILAGLLQLANRWRCCRPGYFRLPRSQLYPEIVSPVRLADGSIVELGMLCGRVQAELK